MLLHRIQIIDFLIIVDIIIGLCYSKTIQWQQLLKDLKPLHFFNRKSPSSLYLELQSELQSNAIKG